MNASSLPLWKGCFEYKVDLLNSRAGQRARKIATLMRQSFSVQYSVYLLVKAPYLVHFLAKAQYSVRLQVKAKNRFKLEPHHLDRVQINLGYSLSHPLVMARMSLDFD